MGLGGSRLSQCDVDELARVTKLTPKEIRNWHKTFHRDHPDGHMTLRGFKKMYRTINPGDLLLFAV